MKKLLVALGVFVGAALLLDPTIAHAAIINNPDPRNLSLNSISATLVTVIKYFTAMVSVIAAIFILASGYQYVLAAGNPEKIEKAKMGLTWSIGGFILAASAFAIVDLIQGALQSKHRVSQVIGSHTGPQSAAATVDQIAGFLFAFAGAIGVIYLILGGYRYVTSQGNQESIEKAKLTILYSVIGLVVVFMSATIFSLVRHSVTY